jgi:repressor LexA
MTISGDAGRESPRLSGRQQEILAVIREWIRVRGYPPTVREIGAAVGLGSPSSVAHHLKMLEGCGLLRRDARGSRAVAIDGPVPAGVVSPVGDEAVVTVPVLGTIAAGIPIPAEQAVEDELTLPSALVGHGTMFALRVRGDSMTKAAICDGDVVVVRQQSVADSGEIVAALIDGEATIKIGSGRSEWWRGSGDPRDSGGLTGAAETGADETGADETGAAGVAAGQATWAASTCPWNASAGSKLATVRAAGVWHEMFGHCMLRSSARRLAADLVGPSSVCPWP